MSFTQHIRRTARVSAPQSLSTEQLRYILSLAKEDPNLQDLYDVVTIISNIGFRVGELRELRWADVDFDKHEVALQPHKGFARRVPFGPKTFQVLQTRRERQPESVYVLGNLRKRVIHRVSRQIRTISDRVGIPCAQLYILRRTFFKRLVTSGASSQSILTIGGWKSAERLMKSLLTSEQRYKIAARELAQIEEME